jgi:hypothetical protein
MASLCEYPQIPGICILGKSPPQSQIKSYIHSTAEEFIYVLWLAPFHHSTQFLQNNSSCVRVQVLTTTSIKVDVLWDVGPCILADTEWGSKLFADVLRSVGLQKF